ncbi:hypothetical protein QEH56_24475 [Pelagicoccus enzymogenes]|uniref:DUF6985 domain-containing protein n=1 Tax=Pelagicoccus enzymogenes TaxID=2773457 RepID=UPI0028101871|nr:hypothetical protein [Pelagicoccus enzymogenes]MDQ8201338.1 hypothetical protein [Pelagicoccus enzymogenes]
MEETIFNWDDYFWVADVNLESWRKLWNKPIELTFAPEGRDDSPLTSKEKELVQWVLDHEQALLDSFVDAVFKEYPEIKKKYSRWMDEEEIDEYLPEVKNKEELIRLISEPSIKVHQIQGKGAPFIGVQANCTWDDEHALGVLMHGSEVLEIGGADTSFLLWMAERHAKKINT